MYKIFSLHLQKVVFKVWCCFLPTPSWYHLSSVACFPSCVTLALGDSKNKLWMVIFWFKLKMDGVIVGGNFLSSLWWQVSVDFSVSLLLFSTVNLWGWSMRRWSVCLNAFPSSSFLSMRRLMESSLGSMHSFGSMTRMPVVGFKNKKHENPVIPVRRRKYPGCWSCELYWTKQMW